MVRSLDRGGPVFANVACGSKPVLRRHYQERLLLGVERT